MRLIVNGQRREIDALSPEATLADFIQTLSLKPDRVAVERNGEIVPRTHWAQARLAEDDKLEVVHFVGGGAR